MTNPTRARRAFPADLDSPLRPNPRRRRLSRALPAGAALIASALLAAAAAVDGQAAALVLALWVAVLVVLGMKLSEPAPDTARGRARTAARTKRRMRAARRPVLMLGEIDETGAVGASRTLPVVASDAAIAVLDARPRG